MKKIATIIASIAVLLSATHVYAAPILKNYPDIVANGWVWEDTVDNEWDVTQCDLSISYKLDMSGYVPPMWNTAWSSIGVGDGSWGWMSSGAPAAAQQNPNSQDMDDKLNLGAPGRYDEASYDATGPETLVTPPIGNPWLNYGIWFDRTGVDPYQALMWGMVNGKTYNTNGLYDVIVTYHKINSTQGTMFATVNGAQTGFYDTWRNGPPHHYPVGKSIAGNLAKLRVFASIWGQNVKVTNFSATGCQYWTLVNIDIKPGSDPNSINLKSKGVVSVAVLTTTDFDATIVDPSSVYFAGSSPVKSHLEDVDGDGDMDILFQFDTLTLGLDGNSTAATLTGDTVGGLHIKGTDSVNIVPKSK